MSSRTFWALVGIVLLTAGILGPSPDAAALRWGAAALASGVVALRPAWFADRGVGWVAAALLLVGLALGVDAQRLRVVASWAWALNVAHAAEVPSPQTTVQLAGAAIATSGAAALVPALSTALRGVPPGAVGTVGGTALVGALGLAAGLGLVWRGRTPA